MKNEIEKGLPVLTFRPVYKSVIWGGERIARFKGEASKGPNIGESWEISPMEGHESVVDVFPDNTPEIQGIAEFLGLTLPQIVERRGDELMGRRLHARFGRQFPLLVKIIDSNRDLSIQVHPNDALAARRHNSLGKTEMWYSLDPSNGAYLYTGFNRLLSPADYRRRIADKTIVDTLRKFYTHPDDVFFLPSGRVHAIGSGNLVLEIQEASDITYRIYDYDRRDSDGHPRELHVEQSVEAINLGDVIPTEEEAPNIPVADNVEKTLVANNFFTVTALGVRGDYELALQQRDSFTVLFVKKGRVEVTDCVGRRLRLRKGQSALVPASCPKITLKGNADVVTSYIS